LPFEEGLEIHLVLLAEMDDVKPAPLLFRVFKKDAAPVDLDETGVASPLADVGPSPKLPGQSWNGLRFLDLGRRPLRHVRRGRNRLDWSGGLRAEEPVVDFF
jgi:hypothetical protein